MKNAKLTHTKHFLMTLMILAGMFSCQKETIKPNETGEISATSQMHTKEGDDDEEVILQGGVTTGSSIPVPNARVYLYKSSDTTFVNTDTTDTNGQYEMLVLPDTYFIEVIETNQNSTKTGNFDVESDTTINIVV